MRLYQPVGHECRSAASREPSPGGRNGATWLEVSGVSSNVPRLEDLQSIRRCFETYLHQDWTIDGESLEEVFENNGCLGGIRLNVKAEAQSLIDSDLTDVQLDQLFTGQWGAGYEPEVEEFEDWRAALREIVRLCNMHLEREVR